MNLLYPSRQPRSGPAGALAIFYPKVGSTLRVPLRRTAPTGSMDCEQHPERQLMRWLNRMAAARPGFPLQVKSILLLTSEPLCTSCRQALTRYLSQYQLAQRLRIRTLASPPCGCGASRRPGPVLLLDELLAEMEDPPESAPAAGLGSTPGTPVPAPVPAVGPPPAVPPAKPVNKHRSTDFQKAKADLKRQSIDDPDLPKADRGWLKQERNQRGNNPRKWRNPPGKDVGHIDPKDNKRVRWEGASQNRSRGGKFKREISPYGAEALTGFW